MLLGDFPVLFYDRKNRLEQKGDVFMQPNHSKRNKSRSFGAGVGIGVGVSVTISIALAMLLATFILNEQLGENTIDLLVPFIMFISTLIGCTLAGKWSSEKVGFTTGISALTYLLIFVGAGILFFDGGFHHLWTSLAAIGCSCGLSCAICIRGKGKGLKRKRPYR